MSESRKAAVAVLLAPLLLVAWFLWPILPFDHSLKDIALAVVAAYALFFVARFLGSLAVSFIGRDSRSMRLSMRFLAADAVSLIVRLALARFTSGVIIDRELRGAALDALWCTLAIAMADRIEHGPGAEAEPETEEEVQGDQ